MCVLEKSHVCMFVLEWCEINSLDGFRMIYLDIETISPKHHQRHFLLPRETRCFLRCPGSMDSHHFRAAWKITIRYCRKLPCPVATQRTESGCFVMLCFVRVFFAVVSSYQCHDHSWPFAVISWRGSQMQCRHHIVIRAVHVSFTVFDKNLHKQQSEQGCCFHVTAVTFRPKPSKEWNGSTT